MTFLERAPPPSSCGSSRRSPTEKEQVAHIGRELYAWHPDGVARSKLAALMAGKGLGVTGTARNRTTVTKLLEMADRVARTNGSYRRATR